jgi:hypothetical protein
MAFHVTPIVQTRSAPSVIAISIECCTLSRRLLGVASLADLRAGARQQFVAIDRAHQIVVDADLEPAQQPRVLLSASAIARIGRHARPLQRAPGCTAVARRNSQVRARRSEGRNCRQRHETAHPPDWSRHRPYAPWREHRLRGAHRMTAGHRPEAYAPLAGHRRWRSRNPALDADLLRGDARACAVRRSSS